MKNYRGLMAGLLGIGLMYLSGCKTKANVPTTEEISAVNLKRGDLIVCGPADKKFGRIAFESDCPSVVKEDFELAVALLHSFEYDEAEKVFAKVIAKAPEFPMAYWGVALSNYHLLWTPPSQEELKKGAAAIAIAKKLQPASTRMNDYVNAAAELYRDFDKQDHKTRCKNYELAMEKIYKAYPDDKEAAVFYALALNATADPKDTLFNNQRKAGDILNAMYPNEPNHPGVVHYLIHTYDNPLLADRALEAARKYAAVAPSSAHALHMPSHIFTRLGYWDESINSNVGSVSSAKCYAEQTGIKGHWDEEIHGLDYLMYAYLQKGDNKSAREQLAYLKTIEFVSPVNFKVSYAFASMPARLVLENKSWKDAAELTVQPANFNWADYPWQNAIIHFARLLGNVNLGNIEKAKSELNIMKSLHKNLVDQKDDYKAGQVKIQMDAGEAWILFKEGKHKEAIALMTKAADTEDNTQKHPVTPGEVIPARELLADMLLQMNKPDLALIAYEKDLKTHPNRLNGLNGAASAADAVGNKEKAAMYYGKLGTRQRR
jgi:tetratricopeptide (TPR) repeat protein